MVYPGPLFPPHHKRALRPQGPYSYSGLSIYYRPSVNIDQFTLGLPYQQGHPNIGPPHIVLEIPEMEKLHAKVALIL